MTALRIARPIVMLLVCATLSACGVFEFDWLAARQTQPDAPGSSSERLHAFFQESFDRQLARSPMFQTRLGLRTDYDKWDDISEAKLREDHEIALEELKTLRSFDASSLDPADQLSYRLFEYQAERTAERYKWRFHNYPINQMGGWQSEVPAFLINTHVIKSVDDARAYIARLRGIKPLFEDVIIGLDERAKRGVIAPEFAIPKAIDDSRNVLAGAPFDKGGVDSPIFADFKAKVGVLDIPEGDKRTLINAASLALVEDVGPAYRRLIDYLIELQNKAKGNNGVWALPNGNDYYRYRLRLMTTTDMTPQEVHDLGLKEVARIRDEIKEIMAKVGFEGSVQNFFAFMKTNERFYNPQTEDGKEAYLQETRNVLAAVEPALDRMFVTRPKAPVVVKAVEPFREKSAGRAFYETPSLDGSRPGIIYLNMYNMRQAPLYEIEALAFHEGVPGHHLQLAIAQELEGVPEFQKHSDYTAFIEGWGLYTERLGKEMGFYQDPYSDFGRLNMELWRACRLVTDTGIHYKKWTRERAIQYLDDNSAADHEESVDAIERYMVWPAQATAYTVGMLSLLEAREKARAALGDRFDIRKFHDVVLTAGAMPVSVLEERVAEWAASGG